MNAASISSSIPKFRKYTANILLSLAILSMWRVPTIAIAQGKSPFVDTIISGWMITYGWGLGFTPSDARAYLGVDALSEENLNKYSKSGQLGFNIGGILGVACWVPTAWFLSFVHSQISGRKPTLWIRFWRFMHTLV